MIPDKIQPNEEIKKILHKKFNDLTEVIKYFEL